MQILALRPAAFLAAFYKLRISGILLRSVGSITQRTREKKFIYVYVTRIYIQKKTIRAVS